MRKRFAFIGSLVGAAAVVISATTSVAGQTAAPKPAGPAAVRKAFTAPKTPWGDPDIQGTWSSDDLRGVPVQRPDEFAGRSELSDEEFAKRAAANSDTRTRELNRVGAFRNDVGTRTFRQTSLIVEPADGRFPPITPDAQREVDRRQVQLSTAPGTWTDRSLYDRCITRGVFGSVLPVIYGNGNMIFQAPGLVSITYEMVHDTRLIPLDGRPHVGKHIQQYLGDARGHFEGNTLVVRTTHIKQGWIRRNGVPQSDRVTTTERFTRHGDMLAYVIYIQDPDYLAEPIARSRNFARMSGLNEGNWIAATPCEPGEETAGPLHQVPHYPIGENPFVGEQAKQSGVPVEALMGGPETTYPEYRQRLPRTPLK